MNVKKELLKNKDIYKVECRDDGVLEIYSEKNVKNYVATFLSRNCLLDCFIRIDYHIFI